MARLYLIGPVTGKPNNNLEEFERVRKLLEEQGDQVDIPHDFVDPRVCWQSAMLVSIHKLTEFETHLHCKPYEYHPHYDGVAMLEGINNSKGARLEKQIAETLGIPCLFWHDYIRW